MLPNLEQLLKTDLTVLTDFMNTKLHDIYHTTIAGKIKQGQPNSQLFNDFASKIYDFSINELTRKLQRSGIAAEFHKYVRQLFLHMKQALMDKEAALLGEVTLSRNIAAITPKTTSSAGLGVIRYIAGRTVHKVWKKVTSRMLQMAPDVTDLKYNELRSICSVLNSFRSNVEHVKSGKYPDTAKVTEQRAYSQGGLTHVSDEVFEFFQVLEEARLRVQTVGIGLQKGRTVLSYISNTLLENIEFTCKITTHRTITICKCGRSVQSIINLHH